MRHPDRTPSPTTHRPLLSTFTVALAIVLVASFSLGPGSDPAVGHTRITTDITFGDEVRTILRRHCMRCHSAGGIAPGFIDLTTYGTDKAPGARAWATAIEEELLTGRMPPWTADPRYDAYSNTRLMTQLEKDMLVAWVEGGAPQGPRRDLPPPAEFGIEEWELGPPDLVVELPEAFVLPAGEKTGLAQTSVELELAPELAEDGTWITGFEFRTDAPQSVARMSAFLVDDHLPPEELELEVQVPYDPFRDEDAEEPTRLRQSPQGRRFLGQWVRGDAPVLLPDGAGKRLRSGTRVELVIEYDRAPWAPQGEVRDRSRVGLFFKSADEEIEKLVEQGALEAVAGGERQSAPVVRKRKRIRWGRGAKAAVPAPGPTGLALVAATTLTENVRLVGIQPAMSSGTEAFEIRASYPDGRRVTLVYVPEYRPEYPSSYWLNDELAAPAGTRIELLMRRAADSPDQGPTGEPRVWIDWVLDDHLVLPEVFVPREGPESEGKVMGNLFTTADGDSAGSPGAPAPTANDPNAAAHMDHTPLHGGQFFMASNQYHHIEGSLPIEGEFRVYVYDDFKKPIDPRNFAGDLVFEDYDPESGDFSEERFPLEAIPGTDYLVARFPWGDEVEGGKKFPIEMFAALDLAGKNNRYDFYFDALTEEPAYVPRTRAAGSAAHSHERPPLTIPSTPDGIVSELVVRRNRVQQQIDDAIWPSLYVPAFDARDLAEALLGRMEGFDARERGAARRAITLILQGAADLDRAGDLEDAARARRAFERFNEGVRTLEGLGQR